MEIAGKRVLVTGASSGIGWASARAFAAAGADVVLLARRKERLERLAAELGAGSTVIAADLSLPGVAARVAEQAGPVDVLMNNAGSEAGGTVWAVGDGPEARHMFEVDLWSPLALIAAVVPGMRDRGGGAVVNVTSIRQVAAWPSFGHSAAAKAALAIITETLRLELRDTDVGVVEVVAGPIETPALGVSRLVPRFVELMGEMFGIGSATELADLIVTAVRDGTRQVFYPSATQDAYRNPTRVREAMIGAVGLTTRVPDEVADSLVVGANHPLLADARAAWEREH